MAKWDNKTIPVNKRKIHKSNLLDSLFGRVGLPPIEVPEEPRVVHDWRIPFYTVLAHREAAALWRATRAIAVPQTTGYYSFVHDEIIYAEPKEEPKQPELFD